MDSRRSFFGRFFGAVVAPVVLTKAASAEATQSINYDIQAIVSELLGLPPIGDPERYKPCAVPFAALPWNAYVRDDSAACPSLADIVTDLRSQLPLRQAAAVAAIPAIATKLWDFLGRQLPGRHVADFSLSPQNPLRLTTPRFCCDVGELTTGKLATMLRGVRDIVTEGQVRLAACTTLPEWRGLVSHCVIPQPGQILEVCFSVDLAQYRPCDILKKPLPSA